MADYRQSCATPSCSYIGFTGHSPGCPVPEEARREQRRRDAEKLRESNEMREPWLAMDKDEFFRELKKLRDHTGDVAVELQELRLEEREALSVLREKHWLNDYMNRDVRKT